MGKIIQFLREARVELGKVVWPTRRHAIKITGVVIIFSVIVSVFLGFVDFGLTKFIDWLISK